MPVLKHTEGLNLLGLARGVTDIAKRARDKKLMPDDVQGGTFTITNPGGYGTFHGTPVISQPQAGILGTYAVVKRPWVVTDELGQDVIAIRPIMNVTLTYDHRLVDGALAGRFLQRCARSSKAGAKATTSVLTVVSSEQEAVMIRGLLETAEIESEYRATQLGENFGGSYEVLVRAEDLEAAQALLPGGESPARADHPDDRLRERGRGN